MEGLLHGEPSLKGDWRVRLRVSGALVTDAKSMYDHLSKTGSMPTERQTLIDLLVARDLRKRGVVKLKWLSNHHMLADCLTKALNPNEVYRRFCELGLYSLVPTRAHEVQEETRLVLRQGQRERAKERKKASRASATPS